MRRKRDVNAYAAVKERSGGVCERCRSARATEVHHRRLRSQRGADSERNLCALCGPCHRHIHANPAESYEAGWLISARYHGAEVAREYEVG